MQKTLSIRRLAAALFAVSMFATVVAQQPPPAAQAPQPPVIFRSEVNYVEVDAVVTDAQGNVVTNLTMSDFELLEDGKPQTISAFSQISLPIERAERPLFAQRAIEPDVQTNEQGEGRIYLIVLDDWHTDPTRAPRVKEAARRFIERNFGTNDLAAVVYTGGRASDSQDFTNNPRLLLAAIDKFTGRKLRSETIGRIESARTNPNTGQLEAGSDPEGFERGTRARNVMNTIRQLAEFMGNVRGRRKAMLLIGEGVDYNIYDTVSALDTSGAPNSAYGVLEDTRDAVAAATRGNVTIYAIDPRGLTSGTEDLISVSGTLEGAGVREVQNELRLAQESLRVLAANTGGFAAVNQNDFNAAFDRIVRENSAYYLLGYYPTNERRDGRWRKLEVRLKRPGLQVRARNGYIAPRGRARTEPAATSSAAAALPALREAIASPLPVSGLPMKVFAGPFKGNPPNAAVALAVEVNVSGVQFTEKDGTYVERLEVLTTATDAKGKVFPGERQTVNLTLKPETYQRVKARGIRVVSQANLPPGRYQMRVAAGTLDGRAGSVLYDLEIPEFTKAPLALSGIAVTSMGAAEVTSIRAKDPLADYLPGPPTASREFQAGDVLTLFGEVYENVNGTRTRTVEITTELRAEDGRAIRNTSEQRASSEIENKSGGYGFTARVPLSDLSPGLYVIHVRAKSSLGADNVASKDILIRVR